jgi:aminoglycoside 6'-N-acetyltransferase
MSEADLPLVAAWMEEPHISRWYLSGSTVEQELDDLRACLAGNEPTHVQVVAVNGRDVGWSQWYRCADYPDHAAEVAARPSDAGIDYAVGDPTALGRGVGTALVAALVADIRGRHPHAGVIADPEACNAASRRVLEKNGFVLEGERVLASERSGTIMAIYRLAPESEDPAREL